MILIRSFIHTYLQTDRQTDGQTDISAGPRKYLHNYYKKNHSKFLQKKERKKNSHALQQNIPKTLLYHPYATVSTERHMLKCNNKSISSRC